MNNLRLLLDNGFTWSQRILRSTRTRLNVEHEGESPF